MVTVKHKVESTNSLSTQSKDVTFHSPINKSYLCLLVTFYIAQSFHLVSKCISLVLVVGVPPFINVHQTYAANLTTSVMQKDCAVTHMTTYRSYQWVFQHSYINDYLDWSSFYTKHYRVQLLFFSA